MPDTLNDLYQDAIYHDDDIIRYGGADGQHGEVPHSPDMALDSGTISLTFELDRTAGEYALISMDSHGNNAGEFTLWVKDGTLQLAMETGSGTEWITVPGVDVTAGEVHHVAITFGEDGLELWYDGMLLEVETDHTDGIALNTNDIVIGGTRAWEHDETATPDDIFQGEIGNVAIFDEQLGEDEMLMMFEGANPELAAQSMMQAQMADLLPAFGQMHHASDTLQEIAALYGIDEHGHLSRPVTMIVAAPDGTPIGGDAGDNGMLGSMGDDRMNGAAGNDILQGSYGNDILLGGGQHDILDGGHGEDILIGGNGNDLLISRADGREPEIAVIPGRDEGDPYGELTDGKVYPDQPLPADDTLVGGAGADIFYFQTLINAKEPYLQEHTRDDGEINWHGVAGENDNLHDHWVDEIGDDTILDFNRAEGDRIVIEGHTTEIGSITYHDSNGDGIMDMSVISLYSDQGSGGGAHHLDELGTITVYGDLVTMNDIEHSAAPAYGIVAGYNDIEEALAPSAPVVDMAPLALPGTAAPAPSGYNPTAGLVFAVSGTTTFDRDARSVMVFDNQPEMQLASGTIALSFTVSEFDGTMFLFSKDASGQDSPGHLSAYVEEDGTLKIRFQDTQHSYYYTVEGAIDAGEEYDLAITFGAEGFGVYLNGVRVAYNEDVTHGWSANSEHLVIGANGWSSTPGTTDKLSGHFNGTISDVVLIEGQRTPEQLYSDPVWDGILTVDARAGDVGIRYGESGALEIVQGDAVTQIPADADFVAFDDVTVRVRDIHVDTSEGNSAHGDDGADYFDMKAGNDTVHGRENDDRAFGGEGADKLYGDDGNDSLSGGAGNDTLYGGRGQDTLTGDDGNDTLRGDDGRDTVIGGAGDDYLYGGADNDTVKGGDGHDTLVGDGGSDKLYGGLGDDKIYGQSWSDAGSDADTDMVYFFGNFDDFTFEFDTSYNSSRGEDMLVLTVTDHASGGADGFYEGVDRLYDIEMLVFNDQTVMVEDLLTG